MTVWLDVRASAELAGRFVARELELHRVLGARAPEAGPPALRGYLAATSLSHAWRAGLFETVLPVSIGLPPRHELVVLASADAACISRLDGAEELVAVLLREVYAPMLDEYETAAREADPLSDAPLGLAAGRAAADLRRVLADGERLLVLRLADLPGRCTRLSAP